jgi:Na+/H+-translocating membrane pyrophosphatase
MSVGLFCSMFAVSLVAFMARCCGRDSELMQFSNERLGFDLSVGAMTQQKIMRILRFGYFLTSAMYLGLSALAVKLLNMDSNMYYCVVIGHVGGYILSIISELATSKESLSSMLATVISVLPGGDVNLDDPNAVSSADLESQSTSSSIPGLSAIKSFVSSAMVAAVIKLRQGARVVSQNALSKLIEPIGSGVLKALIVGMSSSLAPILIIFGILLSCGNLGGTWGITMAGVSMLSTCVMPIAFCAMSPLLSSAATLFIISEHPEEVIEEANAMTWIGDTAANSVKGFTTGAASLVSFCLFFTFTQTAGVSSVDLITDPEVLPGIMLGSVMPNVFAALTLSTLSVVSQTLATHTPKSVADEADAGVMQGSAASYLSNLADTGLTCAMWHLMVPAAFAISLTEMIAFFFNTQVLAGFLAGAIVSGLVMANMLATTGASMDSSSNSNAFGASLKDAGGPSINVLTKLICLVAIINTTKSWALFALVIATAVIVASVFAFNLYRTGKASFDPVVMQEEMDRVRLRATSMIVKPFSSVTDSFKASNLETAETTDVVVETANVMKDVSQVTVPPKESDRDDELDLK